MRRGGGGRRGITGALIADGLAAHGHDVVVLEQRDFPVDWLDRALLKREFGLTAAGAILSPVAARVDP